MMASVPSHLVTNICFPKSHVYLWLPSYTASPVSHVCCRLWNYGSHLILPPWFPMCAVGSGTAPRRANVHAIVFSRWRDGFALIVHGIHPISPLGQLTA